MRRDLRIQLREKAKLSVVKLLGEVMSSGEVLLLSGLGVDGSLEILNALIKACNQLKKEFKDE